MIQGYVVKDQSCYLISTCGNKKPSVQKKMYDSFIWLEIGFIFLEQGECLMAFVFWHDEWETKAKEFMNKIKSWRYYEDDFKECKDEGGCVDGGKNPSQQRGSLPVPQVPIRLTNVWYGRPDGIMDLLPS